MARECMAARGNAVPCKSGLVENFRDESGTVWSYDEEAKLGSGAFGEVFAGHSAEGAEVAIKIVSPKGVPEAERLRDREIEIGGLVAADPPCLHLVRPLGVGHKGQDVMIVMPRATRNLANLLNNGPIDLGRGISIVREIAVGLQELAARSIQHRDLKPENVLEINGRWHLADFGIARNIGKATGAATFKGWGTVEYIAPEVLELKPATVKSDLYALGVIAYEIFAGSLPFVGDDDEIRRQQLESAPPPLPDSLPASLKRLVIRLLRKNPAERHEDARAVVAALDSAQRRLSPIQSELSAAGAEAVRRETEADEEWAAKVAADRQLQNFRRQGLSDLQEILEEAEEQALEALEDIRLDGSEIQWHLHWDKYQMIVTPWPGRIPPPTTSFPLVGGAIYSHGPNSKPDDAPTPLANLFYQHDGESGGWFIRKWDFSGQSRPAGLNQSDFWNTYEAERTMVVRNYTTSDEPLTSEAVVELLTEIIREL